MAVNSHPGVVIVLNCTDQTLTNVSIKHSCGSAPRVVFTVTSLRPGHSATKHFTSCSSATDSCAISLRSASQRQYTGRLDWDFTERDAPQGVIIQLNLDQWYVVNPVAARGEGSSPRCTRHAS
jgi:hypothetical protein